MSTDLATILLATLLSNLRLFVAYIISLVISLVVGVLIARNKYLENTVLPVLDVLQSIPILGFFPVVLVLMIRLIPGGLGVELAVIFLIATSLLWNIIFGVYSSIKSLDPSLFDFIKIYRIPRSTSFFRIYVPAAVKAIGANSIVSWANGWFFITSAEIISSGSSEYKVLGIGSIILEAYTNHDAQSMVIGMIFLISSVILSYLFLWNPFSRNYVSINVLSIDTIYDKIIRIIASKITDLVAVFFEYLEREISYIKRTLMSGSIRYVAMILIIALIPVAILYLSPYIVLISAIPMIPSIRVSGSLVTDIFINATISLLRVVFIVLLSTLISIYLAYRTYLSSQRRGLLSMYSILIGELMASIPAILWWPILSSVALSGLHGAYIVSFIVFLQGSFWYTYFNIVMGLSNLKSDYLDLSNVYGIKGLYFIRYIFIPSLLPAIATGALSCWGGAWNTTIVAEYIDLGVETINLGGIGAYLDTLFSENKIYELSVAIIILSLIIALINRTIWREIFKRVSRRAVIE